MQCSIGISALQTSRRRRALDEGSGNTCLPCPHKYTVHVSTPPHSRVQRHTLEEAPLNRSADPT